MAADVLAELMGILERQTDLVNQLVENSDSSLQNKNIIKSPNSPLGKQVSTTLNSNEKRRLTQVSDIFITQFFKEQKKQQKDTAEKTKVNKVTQPLGQTGKDLNTKGILDKLPKAEDKGFMDGIMNWFLGFLGLKSFLSRAKGIISKLTTGVKKGFMAVGRLLKKTLFGAFKAVKYVFNSLIKAGRGLVNFIKESSLFKKVSEGFDEVVSFFGKHIDALKGKIEELVEKVLSKVRNILPKNLADKLPKIGGASGGATQTVAGEVAESGGKSAAGGFKGWLAKKAGAGKALLSRGVSAVGGTISRGAGAVKGEAVELAQAGITKLAKGALKGAGGAFKLISKAAGPLKRIPVLGLAIEGLFTANDIKNMKEKYLAGDLSEADLQKQAGKRVIEGLTGMLGSAGGAAVGGVLGSFIPVAGNFIGALVGGMAGDALGRFAGGLINDYLLPPKFARSIGAYVTGTNPPAEEMQDFIFSQGKAYPFSSKDEIVGMKQGGPADKLLSPVGRKSDSQMEDEYNKKVLGLARGTAVVIGGKGFVDGVKLVPIEQTPKSVDNVEIKTPKLILENFNVNSPKDTGNLLHPNRDTTMGKITDQQSAISDHMKTISATNSLMIEYLKNIAQNTAIIAKGASSQGVPTKVTNPIPPGGGPQSSFDKTSTVLTDNRASYTKSVYALS